MKESQMAEREKDLMVKFRTVIRGKNSKGGDRLQLYIDKEAIAELSEALNDLASERGVKLDIHVMQRETEEGRRFDSAFAFVKGVQESSNGAPAGGKKKFVPKGGDNGASKVLSKRVE